MTEPVSGAQPGESPAEPKPSGWRNLVHALHPKTVWHMADGQPVVLKQFVQFCLILVYPGWVLGILGCLVVYGLFYVTVYPVLWLLFWPMRAWMKKNRPEECAESRRKK
ncbi:hypothetical protein [Mycobacterium sp. C31M]